MIPITEKYFKYLKCPIPLKVKEIQNKTIIIIIQQQKLSGKV